MSEPCFDKWSTTGCTVWVTGLPAAGKTTIGRALSLMLSRHGIQNELIDGDDLRRAFQSDLGFTREDRMRQALRAAYIAEILSRHGMISVVCLVSPYEAIRVEVRKMLAPLVEVLVDCPLEVCISRDPKGLYRKALADSTQIMTGIQDPFERPDSPDVIVNTHRTPVESGVDAIWKCLLERGLIVCHPQL